jgi:hypothetical protein
LACLPAFRAIVAPDRSNPLQTPNDLFSFAAKATNKDTLSYWEAMKQEDRPLFVEAIEKDVGAHTTREHWTLLPRTVIDPKNKPLQAVWAMKCK